MNVTRLRTLANFLRTLPPERFDMRSWAGSVEKPWRGDPNLSCGTVACAVGWATTIPEFQEADLYLVRIGNGEAYVQYGAFHSDKAVEQFFGLSHDDVTSIFHSDGYDTFAVDITPLDVAEKIEALLDEDSP